MDWEAAAGDGCGRDSRLQVGTVAYSAINLYDNLSPVKYYKHILNRRRCLLLFFVTDQLEFILKICRQHCFWVLKAEPASPTILHTEICRAGGSAELTVICLEE